MNLGSAGRHYRQSELPVRRQNVWVMTNVNCRVAVCVTMCDKNLQKCLTSTEHPGRENKIRKNRHMMAMLLLYLYVWFRVVTIHCWSYRKSNLFFCITHDMIVTNLNDFRVIVESYLLYILRPIAEVFNFTLSHRHRWAVTTITIEPYSSGRLYLSKNPAPEGFDEGSERCRTKLAGFHSGWLIL